MQKIITYTYFLAVLLGIIILILSAVCKTPDITDNNSTASTRRVTNVQREITDSGIQFTFTAPNEIKNGLSLGIYSVHNEIEIFKDGKLQYREKATPGILGKSIGYNWAFVPLTKDDEGCAIVVNSERCYNTNVTQQTKFFFGTVPSLYRHFVFRYIYAIFFGFLLVVIGIALIIYHFVSKHHNGSIYSKAPYSIISLGIFSLFLGLWTGNQAPLTALFIDSRAFNLAMTLVPLILMIPAFVYFSKSILNSNNERVWNIILLINIFVIILLFTTQLVGLADLRETVIYMHVILAISSITIIIMAIKAFVKHGISSTTKYMGIPILVCAISAMADVILYYYGATDSNFFGRAAFLVLIIFAAKLVIFDSVKLQYCAKQTDLYKRLAIIDSMTGFNNRTALSFALNNANYNNSMDYGFVMLDLNSLKWCNDSLGHRIGDNYIEEASKIISEVFKNYGTCYRYGGDEFVVMIKSPQSKKTLERLKLLDEKQQIFNNGSKPYQLGIAWGYAEYHKSEDNTLDDTLMRADKYMYEKKFNMKDPSPSDPI